MKKSTFPKLLTLFLFALTSHAQTQNWPKPEIDSDGTVTVPAFKLPPSVYMSAEAKKALPRDITDEASNIESIIAKGGIPELRDAILHDMTPQINALKQQYAVRTVDTVIAGVSVVRILPAQIKLNKGKILLNLHSGGFLVGSAASMGLLESIPVAAQTDMEVISIQYRQAPEFVFPAASVDVASVYKEMLKKYKPKNIGIFGVSSGGLLTAQSVAWLVNEKLPVPGAIAILSASADAKWAGDSWFWQKPFLGMSSPPSLDERFYYGNHDLNDSLMSPIESDEILKKFPPTLLIAGTRSPELSSAVNTHRKLTQRNIDARLHLWDGLGHAFFTNFDLPESREVFDVVAKFFTRTLDHKPTSKNKQ